MFVGVILNVQIKTYMCDFYNIFPCLCVEENSDQLSICTHIFNEV